MPNQAIWFRLVIRSNSIINSSDAKAKTLTYARFFFIRFFFRFHCLFLCLNLSGILSHSTFTFSSFNIHRFSCTLLFSLISTVFPTLTIIQSLCYNNKLAFLYYMILYDRTYAMSNVLPFSFFDIIWTRKTKFHCFYLNQWKRRAYRAGWYSALFVFDSNSFVFTQIGAANIMYMYIYIL